MAKRVYVFNQAYDSSSNGSASISGNAIAGYDSSSVLYEEASASLALACLLAHRQPSYLPSSCSRVYLMHRGCSVIQSYYVTK